MFRSPPLDSRLSTSTKLWPTHRKLVSISCCTANQQVNFPVQLSDAATAHIKKLKASKEDQDIVFRIGVREGGCSEMSYQLEFVSPADVKKQDPQINHDGLLVACDGSFLKELSGVHIDYKDEIIGGGFKFSNPNASDTCNCGESFSV
eukprot:TRINITY_DN6083_c0_g1_i1.p1 TRINITY_DN6083_c0_g1~~TRINITY_DN6083_c0_g1_i1.p1  ORF type:complete len:161 (+),score=12.76 TRINITY_DN6083_c0_g1_i1:42-485(+)